MSRPTFCFLCIVPMQERNHTLFLTIVAVGILAIPIRHEYTLEIW